MEESKSKTAKYQLQQAPQGVSSARVPKLSQSVACQRAVANKMYLAKGKNSSENRSNMGGAKTLA
jgi:hypothetical protein